ncbi:MAG: hypothetical protein WCC39_17955 [Telluria sp.]
MANDKPATPQAAAATPPTPAAALSTAKQVEELADKLSACADSIHERVMRDIRRSQEQHHGEVPEAEQSVARALLDAEIELRQRANRLYADAAACIAGPLGQSQQHLVALTADAAKKIQNITRIGDGITLVARLLGLAAAAATGQALPILAALDQLKTQLDVVALHQAPAA